MEAETDIDAIPISVNNNNNDKTSEILEESPSADRSPCSLCGRKFLSDRLAKHLQICQKLKDKKRKQFESEKQRSDPEAVPSLPAHKSATSGPRKPANSNKSVKTPPKSDNKTPKTGAKKSNWRAQHADFIRSIRAARGEAVEDDNNNSTNDRDKNGTSGSGRSLPPGMTECPSCQRRFSVKAADRHIEWCREKMRTEQKRKQSAGNQEAMERMKARTKYKPPVQSSRPSSKSVSPTRPRVNRAIPRSNAATSRRTSTETCTESSRANSTNSRLSVATTTTRTVGVNRTNKNLSKSTGNLSRATSRATNTTSRASNYDNGLKRGPSNQTMIVRKGQRSSPNAGVQAKVNTGLYGSAGNLNGKGGSGKKENTAPVMKFKEKFPNHQHQRNNNTIDYDILRKNSTYDDSPKTVPGVRTGGISPTKSDSRMSKSEFASNQIDSIKKRIDMYISGIYDNDLLQRFGNCKNPQQSEAEYDGRGTVNIERSVSAHSVISARGSTSDSSDSGLGSHLPQNRPEVEKAKRGEVFSPSMSELEGSNLKMDLVRNGSLNDIHHLLDGQKDETEGVAGDLTPRFCHTCGTKYPNLLAKFCYECGSKRFPAGFTN